MKNPFFVFLFCVFFQMTNAQNDVMTGNNPAKDSDTAVSGILKQVRYQGIIEAGLLFGLGEWGQSTFRFVMVNALRISHYSVGIGLGFNIPEPYEGEDNTIRFEYQVPFYLDNRIFFTKSGLQPYISFGAGVSFVNHQMVADVSPYLNATAGIFWKISDHVSLNAGVLCESYTVKYEEKYVGIFEHKSTTLGPFVGIVF